MITLKEDAEFITIHGPYEYPIRKDELKLKREGILSEWVMHLMEKTWMEPHILYEIAVITQRIHPNNSIDWFKTFFIVEKERYLDSLSSSRDESETVISSETINTIDLGFRETNASTDEVIGEKVKSALKRYKLN